VIDAWNKATAGLDEQQKMTASINAMLADGQQTITLSAGGHIQVSGSNFVSPEFDWNQFSQNVVASLENARQFNTTPTEQETIQSMINTFQEFQSNLG
jgi:hypothetical protein